VDYQNKYIYTGILFCLKTLAILYSSLCPVTAGWAVVVSVPACYELGFTHFSSMFCN